MKGSALVVRCLEHEGARSVCGVPGDADGRLAGRAGVRRTTLAPGATSPASGVADANLDHALLVAII
jgi:thiamine pyrophosphate-dependent acetolactate synthase large subunit-like protein